MCVKQSPGSSISNKHLDTQLFQRLLSIFPKLEAVVLNGIGEPLLHPDIVNMVELAGNSMSQKSWVGFQTNGLLLDQHITERLLAVGLNRLCISTDDSSTDNHSCNSLIHRPNTRKSPFTLVREVCNRQGLTNFRLGAEIVLMRETLPQLPSLVTRLAGEGVDFIIGSHLLAYHLTAEQQSLFNSCTVEAWDIYRKWHGLARTEGLDIASLTAKTWIAPHREDEHRLHKLYREMLNEAGEQGIWLNVKKLSEWDDVKMARYTEYLAEAETVAAHCGVEISLPPLSASTKRACRFLEENAVFVDVDGSVMPCYPLWHDHTVYMDSEAKHLSRRTFGSIKDQDILAIWQSQEYMEFRQAVLQYDYPFCHSCSLGPCPDITGETTPFINDCFGTPVPCGHCIWCFDGARCL